MARTVKQPYRKSRRFDRTCRCHGGCPWCENNRLHNDRLKREAANKQISEFHEEEKQVRNDLTELVLIIDRSGSMQSCQAEAQAGINTFIDEQKKQPGEARLTLVQFDDRYEFVHKGVNIKDVPAYELSPRGMTALNDAIGKAINETGARLAALPESERPGLVTVLIVTDGLENSSQEFMAYQIKSMIDHQRDKYKWKFNFLGADENAVTQAAALGIQSQFASSYNTGNFNNVVRSMSGKMSAAREATYLGFGEEHVAVSLAISAKDRADYTAKKQ